MSEKRVKVEREVSEREIKVERESILNVVQENVPTGTFGISNNGTYDIGDYKYVEVNVPQGLIPTGTKEITRNGTHNVEAYAEAEVSVPGVYDYISSEAGATDTAANLVTKIPAITIPQDRTSLEGFLVSLPNITEAILTGGAVESIASIAANHQNLSSLDLSGLSFSQNGVDMSSAFSSTSASVTLPSGSKVTNVNNLFSNSTLEEIDLSGLDTSECTNFVRAFYQMTHLKKLNISGWTNPNGASTERFCRYDSSLETVIINSDSVFTLTSSASFGNVPSSCNFYVPDELVDNYKAADYWSALASQIKPLSELPEEYRV